MITNIGCINVCLLSINNKQTKKNKKTAINSNIPNFKAIVTGKGNRKDAVLKLAPWIRAVNKHII